MRMAEDSNFVMATWPCGLRPHFLHWSKLGPVEGSNPDGGICSFFFAVFFFHLIFTLWFVSVYSYRGPFKASRDFCDNVFLVLVYNDRT